MRQYLLSAALAASKTWLRYFVPGFATGMATCLCFGGAGRDVWLSWGIVIVVAWLLCMCLKMERR